MSLFKILRGDSSRIDTNTTPFHDGYAYFTPDDGGLYIDAIVNDDEKRIRVNPEGIPVGEKGAANGVATLGSDGKVPTIQLDMENSAISGSTKPITSGAVYSILGTVEAALSAI